MTPRPELWGQFIWPRFCAGERANLKIDRPERFIQHPMGNRSRPDKVAQRLHLSWFVYRHDVSSSVKRPWKSLDITRVKVSWRVIFFSFFPTCEKSRLSLVLIESRSRIMMHIRIMYQTLLRVIRIVSLVTFFTCIYFLFMLDKIDLEESFLNVIRWIYSALDFHWFIFVTFIKRSVHRLQALGRTAPEYTMKWRSESVIANTHKSGPSPAPNHVINSSTGNGLLETRILILFAILLAYVAGCWVYSTHRVPYTFLFTIRDKLLRTSLRFVLLYHTVCERTWNLILS